jgi:hypothetical protein
VLLRKQMSCPVRAELSAENLVLVCRQVVVQSRSQGFHPKFPDPILRVLPRDLSSSPDEAGQSGMRCFQRKKTSRFVQSRPTRPDRSAAS